MKRSILLILLSSFVIIIINSCSYVKEIFNCNPKPEPVFPRHYEGELHKAGIKYTTDSTGCAIVPRQLIFQFKPGTSDQVKADLLGPFHMNRIASCRCDSIELWGFEDNYTGDIGLDGVLKGTASSSDVDNVDYNRLVFNEIQVPDFAIRERRDREGFVNDLNQCNKPATKNIFAIIDSGVDLTHPYLCNYIINKSSEADNDVDDDENCLVDDTRGWNYVDDNELPDDDHSHGTHVAGIIVQQMKALDSLCDFGIISYRTHNAKGAANLFDVTCATYQAVADGAKVINASWGYIGPPSEFLSDAIDFAVSQNVLFVAASGNDTINLDDYQQYPACDPNKLIITVGSHDTGQPQNQSDFSNYSPVFVDVLALGDRVTSTVPFGQWQEKDGTSMAAPVVSAAAMAMMCSKETYTIAEIRDALITCAKLQSTNNSKSNNFEKVCLSQ